MTNQPDQIEIKHGGILDLGWFTFCAFGGALVFFWYKTGVLGAEAGKIRVAASQVTHSLILIGGLALIRYGISILLGSRGVVCDRQRREFRTWSRGFLLNKKYEVHPFDRFDTIAITEEKRAAFPARVVTFCVRLAGPKAELEVKCFGEQKHALNLPERLSPHCGLPIQQ
jgi:hypothetical protein